ncbi:MAG: hypothetical protein AAGA84_02490 [Pseudomonadota bacterium]
MQQWARWIMHAKHRQILLLASLMLLPGLQVVSIGIAVASVIATGATQALTVLVPGFGIVIIANLFSPENSFAAIAPLVLICFSALVLGEVLRRTASLTLTIQAVALIASLVVAGMHLGITDIVGFWATMLQQGIEAYVSQGIIRPLSGPEMNSIVEGIAPIATGMVVGSMALFLVLALLLGYFLWDHGCDDAKARFGRFRDLNLGRTLAVVLIVMALLMLTGSLVWTNMAIVLLVVFGLHGLALVHWAKNKFGLPILFMWIFYAAVIVVKELSLLVCVAGYVDAWFNFLRGDGSNQRPEAG